MAFNLFNAEADILHKQRAEASLNIHLSVSGRKCSRIEAGGKINDAFGTEETVFPPK